MRLILTLLAALSLGLAACSPVALYAWWSESRARAQGLPWFGSVWPMAASWLYREAGHGPTPLLIHGFGGNGLCTGDAA